MNPALALLEHHGAALLFGWVFAEQLGLPLPSIPLLLAAGALARAHRLNPFLAAASALAAVLAADVIWFEIGRRSGVRVLRFLCEISLEPDSCVRRTEDIFAKHGAKSLLAAKFVPGFETVAPPLAGITRMGLRRFLVYDGGGAALYVGTYLALGAIFAGELERVAGPILRLGKGAFVLLLAALACWIAWKLVRRRRFLKQLRIDRITPQELKRKIDAGEAVAIVDLRGELEFQAAPAMIPGAVHLDSAKLEDASAELSKASEVVLYCNCPNEAASAKHALLLRRQGLLKIRPLLNGLDGWRNLGYPLSGAFEGPPEGAV